MGEADKNRRRFWRFRRIGYWLAVSSLWGGIALGVVLVYFALTLPSTDDLWAVEQAPEISYHSVEEALLARRGRRGGQAVRYGELPPHLIDAVIAIEDRRFFSHYGLDPRGLARALLANLAAGRLVQGGSTLTQQLAKNVFLTPERTIKRKVQEVLLAFWLEARFSKQEILGFYFNRVYFGNGTYGVSAAAQSYFDKPVQSLTVAEAALLAGLLKAPTRYAPTRDPQAAAARRRLVLMAMQESGKISKEQALKANATPLIATASGHSKARYAIDWVQDLLPDFVGRPRTDLDVMTTLDPDMQMAAEAAIKSVMAGAEMRGANQAAMVVMTPDGAVRALVGGRDYAESQYNRAVLSRRQPGSAFKPVVYLAALEAGRQPDAVLVDKPVTIEGWSPGNYDEKYRGELTLRDALALSINTVAVQVSEQTGRGAVIALARRLGIATPLRPHPSLALGSFEVTLLELTALYAHFANGGRYVLPHVINAVTTANGSKLYLRQASPPPQLVDPKYIGALNDMLSYALSEGTGRAAKINGLQLAGKTGTSQNWRDAWFVGYSGALVAGVWVGNDDGLAMQRVTGGSLPAQIWKQFMQSQYQLNAAAALPGDGAGGQGRSLLDWLF